MQRLSIPSFLVCLAVLAPLLGSCGSPRAKAPAWGREASSGAPRDLLGALQARALGVPLVIAHRGDSQAFPENTLAAFQSAVALGANLVELDVRQTRDGELVCLHDEDFDRTTDSVVLFGKKGIRPEDLSLSQVEKLEAGSWKAPEHRGMRIPTLNDALAVIQKGAIAMIEHKSCDPVRMVELLKRRNLTRQVVVQSFDWKWLERVHSLEPSICLAALGKDELTEEQLLEAHRVGAGILHWDARSLTAEAAERALDAGFLLAVYTVNDELTWFGAWSLGVGGMTTDRPAALKALVSSGRFGATP